MSPFLLPPLAFSRSRWGVVKEWHQAGGEGRRRKVLWNYRLSDLPTLSCPPQSMGVGVLTPRPIPTHVGGRAECVESNACKVAAPSVWLSTGHRSCPWEAFLAAPGRPVSVALQRLSKKEGGVSPGRGSSSHAGKECPTDTEPTEHRDRIREDQFTTHLAQWPLDLLLILVSARQAQGYHGLQLPNYGSQWSLATGSNWSLSSWSCYFLFFVFEED